MKRLRFTEEQIISVLREQEAGFPTAEVCRRHGVSSATFDKWKSKYGELEPRVCLALEDSHNGVRSASAAGLMTLMVPDLLEPTEEIRGLCTLIVPNLHEV